MATKNHQSCPGGHSSDLIPITKEPFLEFHAETLRIMAAGGINRGASDKKQLFFPPANKINPVKCLISLTSNKADLFYGAGNRGHIYNHHNSKLVTFPARRERKCLENEILFNFHVHKM